MKTKRTIFTAKNIIRFLILSLFSFSVFSNSVTRESCEKDFQNQLNELITNSTSAKDLADFSVGLSYQKLAYAHHVYNSSRDEASKKSLEGKLDDYLRDSNITKAELFERLDSFNDSMIKPDTKLNKKDEQYIEALSIFSQTLDKKYNIQSHEKKLLKKFGNKSRGKLKDSQNMFIGDIANNFHRRRFIDENGNQLFKDQRALKAKFHKYPKGIRDSLNSLAKEIQDSSIGISKDCQQFAIVEQSDNSLLCNIFNPFSIDDSSLLGNASVILEHMYTDGIRDIKSAIPVRYAGAQTSVTSCDMEKNEDGTWNIDLGTQLGNIPADKNGKSEWTVSLEGGHTQSIPKSSDENGFTFQKIDHTISFSGVSLSEEQLNNPLSIQFESDHGNEMFSGKKAGSISSKVERVGDQTYFNVTCARPEVKAALPEVSPDLTIEATEIDKELYVTLSFIASNIGDLKRQITITELSSKGEIIKTSDMELDDNLTAKYQVLAFKKAKYIAHLTDLDSVKKDISIDNELKIDASFNNGTLTASVSPTIKGLDYSSIAWQCGDDSKKIKEEFDEKNNQKDGPENEDDDGVEQLSSNCGQGKEVAIAKDSKAKSALAIMDSGYGLVYSNEVSLAVAEVAPKSISISVNAKEAADKTTLTAEILGQVNGEATYKWSCQTADCPSTTNTQIVTRTDAPITATVEVNVDGKTYTGTATVNAKKKVEPKKEDKEDKDDDEEEEEECTQEDAFSPKVCKGKEAAADVPVNYMPPMQPPLILPSPQSYMTPAFN